MDPETVEALRNIKQSGDLVFSTFMGNPWVRTIQSVDKNGNVKEKSLLIGILIALSFFFK